MIKCIAPLALLLCSTSAIAENRVVKDWEFGCDNVGSCVAIGTTVSVDLRGFGYIRVERGAASDAAPRIVLGVGELPVTPGEGIAFVVDGPLGFTSTTTVRSPGDRPGMYIAVLSGEDAMSLIAALRAATRVDVGTIAKSPKSFALSLSGAVAALTYMDDRQGRVATASALLAKRGAPHGEKVTFPRPAVVDGIPLRLLVPAPPVPSAISRYARSTSCGERVAPLAFATTGGAFLWGICSDAGAYNVSYRFFVEAGGAVTPADFEVPAGEHDQGSVLTNPALAHGGLELTHFARARGVGDAGNMASWTWNGARFQLIRYSRMDGEFGVQPEGWPASYRASVVERR